MHVFVYSKLNYKYFYITLCCRSSNILLKMDILFITLYLSLFLFVLCISIVDYIAFLRLCSGLCETLCSFVEELECLILCAFFTSFFLCFSCN